MKIWLLASIGILSLLLSGTPALGQITINQSDSPLNVGAVNRSTTISQFQQIPIVWDTYASGSGGGHVWDFSNVAFDFGYYQSTVINASAAPGNSSFPGATKAWRTDFVNSWTFFSTPPNEIRSHGSISTYGAKPDTIKMIFAEPYLQYKFPVTGNSSWISKWQYTLYEYDSLGTPFKNTVIKDSIQWVCDAWGTIKYKNRQVSALRLKGTYVITSTINIDGLPPQEHTSTSDQLQFMTVDYNGGGASLSKSVSGATTYISGSADYRFVQATTPVYENTGSTLPTNFEVSQNSPNPFNPETTIGYSLDRNSNVKFEVFNLLGQTVWREDFGDQPAGNYTVRWNGHDQMNQALPSGVYFYRISAGSNVATKKMVLLK
jgi:hypothetical protein